MRIASICPTCTTYENALCIIYNGIYLSLLDVSPLDSLESILEKINDRLSPKSGAGTPNINADYIGQTYIDDNTRLQYYAKAIGTGINDWRLNLSASVIGIVPEYTDNTTALAGGLVIGEVYRTGDVMKICH